MVPTGYATTFEILMYALWMGALRHAWRTRGGPGVLYLMVGVVYGVTLEAATLWQLDAYHYGRFWVMLPPGVPLAIGVGWSLIVYGAKVYSDALALPWWWRAVLNGLLALNIDLSMDVVAIRLGFWDWGFGPNFQFFGVPWANFWAWFWVVAGFTAVEEALDGPGKRGWLAPFAALAAGLIIVLATNALLVFVLVPVGLANEAVAVVLSAALIAAWKSRFWKRWRARPDPFAGVVARAFHGYFLLAGLCAGVWMRTPALLLVTLLMLAVEEGLYRGLTPRSALANREGPFVT